MEKKKNIVLVLLFIIIGVMACFGIKMSKEIVEIKQNINENNTEQNKNYTDSNKNDNNQQNEEISLTTKKELLNMVGLTENGYKRNNNFSMLDDDMLKEVDKDNSVSLYWLDLAAILITMDDHGLELNKETNINMLSSSLIKEIINATPSKYVSERKEEFDVPDDEYDCSSEGSGLCEGISFDEYKKIAKKYNLNEDGSKYFSNKEIYNGYYLFHESGGIDDLAKISDSYDFEKKDDSIILTYNIKLEFYNKNEGRDYDRKNFNKKITYTFKQYNDGSYYLNSIKIIKLQ